MLKIQLGLQESTKLELADEMESGDALVKSSMLLTAEQFNINRNVDYQLIQSAEKIAKLDLNLSKMAFLPTISGFYNHNEQLNSTSFNFSPRDLVGINLTLPIFSSGERLSVVSQKRMPLAKTRHTSK